MYDYLKGKIIDLSPTHVVLENEGKGYRLNISLYTYGSLKKETVAKLFIHTVIKNDSQATSHFAMYGFTDETERKLFMDLVGVSGIGNNTALLILSSYGPEELVNNITGGDVASMQKIKGIGAKTAQRVIVDLQDKLKKISGVKIPAFKGNTVREESLSALLTLGFNRTSAEKAVNRVLSDNEESSVELVIKEALGHLSS